MAGCLYTASDKRSALETTATTCNIMDRKSILDGGTNCGKGNNYGNRTWFGMTIGGAVFRPAGPLTARTTYRNGVTDPFDTYLFHVIILYAT